jgi:phage-related protein
MASGAELGKAYVQIIPSAQGISGKISGLLGGEVSVAGQAAGASLGRSMVGALTGVIAAAGIGTILKNALNTGGDLQQSFGGLDTIYGSAAEAAKKYSEEAVKAGIASNTYAEQAVSFGASLKQAYGGDTIKAVEAANTAILDMADNSAKMGTDIMSVQNAYQGFAKQNYTMLDNLKLGYGGTKTEMERLLVDAEKLSGIHYDINNLGDVYSAIHIIQEDLGLTGVAAQEASETFTGSFNAMKAAGENFLANLTLGNDISPYLSTLLETTGNFITNNLFPMIGNIFQSLPQVISVGLIPALNSTIDLAIQGLNFAGENADAMVSTAIDMVMALGTAIIEAAPNLTNAAFQCALAFGNALISYDWASLGAQLLTALQGLIPTESATNIMQPILDGITASLPGLLSTGVEIISNLATGILNALPSLLETAGMLVIQFADFVLSNLPTIIDVGIQLVINLATGIINALPKIVEVAQKLILEAAATLVKHMPEIFAVGVTIPAKLAAGIFQALPQIVSAAVKINTQIFDTITSFDWLGLGSDIINGIITGVKQMGDAFITAILSMCQGALGAVKQFFGISSPSKVMANEVGRYIPEGIALGIEQNADVVTDAMEDLSADTIKAADMMGINTKADFTGGSADSSAILARMDAMLTIMSRYFPEIAAQQKEIVTAGDFNINAINRSLGTMMA